MTEKVIILLQFNKFIWF